MSRILCVGAVLCGVVFGACALARTRASSEDVTLRGVITQVTPPMLTFRTKAGYVISATVAAQTIYHRAGNVVDASCLTPGMNVVIAGTWTNGVLQAAHVWLFGGPPCP